MHYNLSMEIESNYDITDFMQALTHHIDYLIDLQEFPEIKKISDVKYEILLDKQK